MWANRVEQVGSKKDNNIHRFVSVYVCVCLVKVVRGLTYVCLRFVHVCVSVFVHLPADFYFERAETLLRFSFWPAQSLLTIVIAFSFPFLFFFFFSPALCFTLTLCFSHAHALSISHFLCLAHLLKNSLVKAFAKENSQLSVCRAKQCETSCGCGFVLLIPRFLSNSKMVNYL